MTHDDAHTSHNHGFALPAGPQVVVRSESRPWRVVAGVAVCLGLAGVIAGLIVARRQSLSDEHLISDALQREELSLELTVQVRNKLMNAYTEIMRMPV